MPVNGRVYILPGDCLASIYSKGSSLIRQAVGATNDLPGEVMLGTKLICMDREP
jgi:hypothetical protein